MIKKFFIFAFLLLMGIYTLPACLHAQNKGAEQVPPANVVVSKIAVGTIKPRQEFIGTVYYLEVSNVSGEVSGRVESITFEEGKRARKGAILVKLDSKLLEKRLEAKRSSYEEILLELKRARIDFERIRHLYEKKIIAEKEYDDQQFKVRGLEKKSAAIEAEVERLEIEQEKTVITAPFTGVVLKKHVARGEWLSPGKTVATIARDDKVDVVVEVPEDITTYLKPGMTTKVEVAGMRKTGKIEAVIPKGDIATRTFPVKIRISNLSSIFEGMEARVQLPVGENISTFLVSRDAVVNMTGKNVVFVVVDEKAVSIPVQITGYKDMKTGIKASEISEGMNVVVKGNERLRHGQPVTIIKEAE
jgi:RND family efflux transporter MFP subunit